MSEALAAGASQRKLGLTFDLMKKIYSYETDIIYPSDFSVDWFFPNRMEEYKHS